MPIYCYKRSLDGIQIWREFRIGQAPQFVKDEDGEIALRDICAEIGTMGLQTETGYKKHVFLPLSGNAKCADKIRQQYPGVEVDNKGKMHINSRAELKRVIKMHQEKTGVRLVDHNGFD